jgi:seryl-tRNA synthetase
MFSFTTAEDSDAEHMKLLAIEEEIMQSLGLSYRVIKQCTGDLGSPAARKFDIEAWVPSQNTYRETHSTSTCTDYQARRLGTRVRRTDGRVELVHTLNGTALSMARILAVLIDNYQQADGSIKIPEVLRNEIGKDAIKK